MTLFPTPEDELLYDGPAQKTAASHIGPPKVCQKHSFYYFPCPHCEKETCPHGVYLDKDWCPECVEEEKRTAAKTDDGHS